MDSEKSEGWPEGIRASSLSAQGRAVGEPRSQTRVVVRLHRTTDPPRAHLWPTFLCEEKGGAAGGSPAKRFTYLASANKTSGAAAGRNA